MEISKALSRHREFVLSVASGEVEDDSVDSRISGSWRRCISEFGLDPQDTPEPVAVAEINWIPAGAARTFDGVSNSATLDCAGVCETSASGVLGPAQTLWVNPAIPSAQGLVVCLIANPWAPPASMDVVVTARELS